MKIQTPTLFDDFFLPDDDQNDEKKEIKKTSKKSNNPVVASESLFDTSDSDTVPGDQNTEATGETTVHSGKKDATIGNLFFLEEPSDHTTRDAAEPASIVLEETEEITSEHPEEPITVDDNTELSNEGQDIEGDLLSVDVPENTTDNTAEVLNLELPPSNTLPDEENREKGELSFFTGEEGSAVLDFQYASERDYFDRPESQELLSAIQEGGREDNEDTQEKELQDNRTEEPAATIPFAADEDDNDNDNDEHIDAHIKSFVAEDWSLTKHYYAIGEVAEMFGVNISHIRFWTNEFKLNPRTNKKGNRYYTPQQIQTLQLINYLVKVKKHTIKGAREKLKTQKKMVQKNMELKDALSDLKSKLEELKNQL